MPKLELRTENFTAAVLCRRLSEEKVLELGEEVNKRIHYVVAKGRKTVSAVCSAIMCPDAIIEVYK